MKNILKIFFNILARATRNIVSEPWFIGLMIALAMLIIILINVCVLVRERGGKYSIQEKEPFRNQITDGQGFDEYQGLYVLIFF
jgi:neuronal cell adhesion protein